MHVFEQGDAILIAVFIVLAAMSVFSWFLIFQKLGKTRIEQISLQTFQREIMVNKDWPLTFTPLDTKTNVKSGSLAIVLKQAFQNVAGLSADASAERREKILTA